MTSPINDPQEDSGRHVSNKPKGDPAAESASSPPTAKESITEAQKREARAPQVPPYSVPPAKPAEPGKPVWPKTHSG